MAFIFGTSPCAEMPRLRVPAAGKMNSVSEVSPFSAKISIDEVSRAVAR